MSSVIFLFSLLNLLLLHASSQVPCPSPDEIILLNCGTSSSSTFEGRVWNGDSSNSNSNFQKSLESKATIQAPGVNSIPFMTARISYSNFTYSFPDISPGPKFIRLYFYPATYTDSNINTSNSLFTVTANNFTLLKNFSAFLNLLAPIPQLRTAFVIKEFIVTVQKNQTLNISFTPSPPSSLVFINGIEIVPIPENLYIKDMETRYKLTNYYQLQKFYNFDNSTALETMYRLNVGGGGETDVQLFRRWGDDTNYIDPKNKTGLVITASQSMIKYNIKTTCYAAPPFVYDTARSLGRHPMDNLKYNLTWKFSVDSGFDYLVRMHFCETGVV